MSNIQITRDTNRVTRKIVFPLSPSRLPSRPKSPSSPRVKEIDYGLKDVPKDFIFTYVRPTTPPPLRKSRSRSKSPVEKESRSLSRSRSREREPKHQKQARWEHYSKNHNRILRTYFRQDINVQIDILSQLVGEALKKVYLHPVRGEHVWERLPFSEDEFDQATHEQEFHTEPPCFGWQDLAFGPYITVLHISSDCNGNDDTRGGGCGELNIPLEEFSWTIQNPNGITFQNLVEAVYRMKGSKYDWWYELYGGIAVEKEKDHKAKHEIYICTSFEYGS